MRGSWEVVRRHAAVLAVCVVAGLAAPSCAVMSSSSDCANKASCADDGGGSSGGGSEAATGEAGDDGLDATGPGDDVAEESAAMDTGASDGTVQEVGSADVRSEDGPILDATTEADASLDAVADRAVDAPVDACVVSGPESCSNGLDDNCDGKIDCADPTCTGYTCAAAPPSGWTGPVLLWTGASTAAAPACPTGYPNALDLHANPTGSPDTCGCSCAALGQTCTVTGTIYRDMGCASNCVASQVPSGCTALPANACGVGGSFLGGGVPAPTGGSCNPLPTTTPGSAMGWSTSARICSLSGVADTPGGCSPSNAACVPASPGPANGFAATPCVYQPGDLACPAGYPNNRNLIFSSESDQRSCTACTCASNTPTGGTCTGTISIFPVAGCTGPIKDVYTLGAACLMYNDQSPTTPMSIQGDYVVTPLGACPAGPQPQPTGSVVGTGPTTVCCM